MKPADPFRHALVPADGFEVGVGPSVVVLDEGKAKNSTTTTMKDDIYAFIFGQKGLMAGLGIQGNKMAKINPKFTRERRAKRSFPIHGAARPQEP
jgi:lipid-binding SYLF domain-containing protein